MKAISELKINKSQIEKLAINLHSLMKSRNISDAELARALDLPSMTVRRIVLGETTDPRISTLKLIADYFEVSIDAMLNGDGNWFNSSEKRMPQFIPILDWKLISTSDAINKIKLDNWPDWHPIAISSGMNLSANSFAIESRPSMQPRYPHGTLLIIDPDETPNDSDVILIKIKNSNDLSLRELIIDPPRWQLLPIINGSEIIFYEEKEHKIIGVLMLTMLYTRREKNKK
jgi:transcriptional regulator with XRE-family HTH domain